MVLGGFEVAPAPPFVYIFGWVCVQTCLPKPCLFLFLFLKSLITGSGAVACRAATQQQQQQHVRDKSALFRIDRKFIN